VGNKILVSVFDSEQAAFEGLTALKEPASGRDITLYASSVIAKDPRALCLSSRGRTRDPSARSWAWSPAASSGCSGPGRCRGGRVRRRVQRADVRPLQRRREAWTSSTRSRPR